MKITVRLFALLLAAVFALSAPVMADGRDETEKTKKAAAKKTGAKKTSKKPAKAKSVVKKPAKVNNAQTVQPLAKKNAVAAMPASHEAKTAKAAVKPAPPAEAFVLFESKPANAEVVIDGFYSGSTPIQLPLKEGKHKIKLVYPGYQQWERQIIAYRGMRLFAQMEEIKTETAQKP
ncbi:MAG: PEGA domain-containing protein [Nitrospinae bacterium]|nr:PEGA domain-containing protein [Nitrospinota bacterium]